MLLVLLFQVTPIIAEPNFREVYYLSEQYSL